MRNVAHETGIYLAGVSAGRIAMLLPSRMAGRTLDLRGPDLARGPEVARRCCRWSGGQNVDGLSAGLQTTDVSEGTWT